MDNKLQKLPLIALFAALFAYVLVRANGLSFTHDESLSYTIIKGSPLWATSPNNHTLNTWLMGICSTLFGDRELSLRLPNVLAFLVYLTFVFLLLKGAKSSLLAFLGAILMLINPFFLDFFSIARGYGLSLGFMAASLYFFLRRDLNEHTGNSFLLDFTIAMFFAFLVVLSNLSAINFFLALLSVFMVQYPLWAFLYRRGKLWHHLAFAGILVLAAWSLKGSLDTLLQLSRENQLYFGEKTLTGSLDSLIKCSFYFSTYPEGISTFVRYAVIGLLATAMITAVFQKFLHNRLQKVLSLFLLIAAGFVAEHHLFGANYPAERTALIFVPLFGLACYEMAAIWRQKFRPLLYPGFEWGLLVLLALPLAYHFVSNANLQYTHTWQYDAHTKDAMEVVARANSAIGDGTETISISNSALFEPAINYYREINKLTKVQPATRDPLNVHATFIYEFETNDLIPKDLERVAEFRDIKTVLFKGKAAVANTETEKLPK